jgi:uncharacterized DUF497 family protein
MRITWGPAKAAENLRDHRVDLALGASVLDDPFAIRIDDPRHDEPRFLALGATLSGQILVVVYTYEDNDTLRLISAREASRAERRRYADEPR